MVSANRTNLIRLATGRLSSNDDTLTFELVYEDQPPKNFVPFDSDLVLWLNPGLVLVPETEAFELSSELESVLRDRNESSDILFRTLAESTTETVDPGLARVELVLPHLLTSGSFVRIRGSGFGDTPQILFPMVDEQSISIDGLVDENGVLSAPLPAGVVDGLIRVDNGNGAGNGYLVASWFNPSLELEWVEESAQMDLAVHLVRHDDVYPIQAYDIHILSQDLAFADFEPEQQIGTFQETFDGILKGLFIKEINGDEMTVEVRHLEHAFVFEILTFAIDQEGEPSLRIHWEELSPTLTIRKSEGRLTLTLDGDVLDLPAAGTSLIAIAETRSALTKVGFFDGVDTSLSGLDLATLRNEE